MKLVIWELGWCYFKTKKQSRFVSLGVWISVLGIALGIMVLITVLSVMNGFDYEIHQKIFKYTRPLTLIGYQDGLDDYELIKNQLFKDLNLVSSPFLMEQGMLLKNKKYSGVVIQGIEFQEPLPEVLKEFYSLRQKFNDYVLFLGRDTANHLRVQVGDSVILVIPQVTTTLGGVIPRMRSFEVIGIFEEKLGNHMTAYMPLKTVQKLLNRENVTGLSVNLSDFYRVFDVSNVIMSRYGKFGFVSTWAQEYSAFFQAVRMEKTVLFVILTFIIAVASFNLIASLIVSVYEKKGEIAILRTLGANSSMIMKVFMVYGGLIGLFGVLLGVLLGIPLALNAPQIVQFIEGLFHIKFIQEGVYFLDYLPSRLVWSDLFLVSITSFIMSILATLYPAWKATTIDPVEVLREE